MHYVNTKESLNKIESFLRMKTFDTKCDFKEEIKII